MQIPTIQKRFEAFEPFESDLKHLNPNSNPSNEIRSIQMQILSIREEFEAFDRKFEPFEKDLKHSNAKSNHSKGSQSVQTEILAIRK